MIADNKRILPTSHLSNRNRRILLHHFLVHLHLRTKLSTMVTVPLLNVPSQGSVVQGGRIPPFCAKSGRNNPCVFREGSSCCFMCGKTFYFMRECPKNKQGNGSGDKRAQST